MSFFSCKPHSQEGNRKSGKRYQLRQLFKGKKDENKPQKSPINIPSTSRSPSPESNEQQIAPAIVPLSQGVSTSTDLASDTSQNHVVAKSDTQTQCPENFDLAQQDLWSQAKNKLEKENPILFENLKKIIGKSSYTIQDSSLHDQINAVTNVQLQRMKDRQWKLRWGAKDIEIRHLIDQIVRVVQIAKDIGDAAGQIDPVHIGLPWAGVCMLLPLVLNESEQRTTALKGLKDVIDIVQYFSAVDWISSQYNNIKAEENLLRAVIKLYAKILEYQATALCYFGRNTFSARFMRSTIKLDDCSSLLEEVNKYKQICLELLKLSDSAGHKEWFSSFNDQLKSMNERLKKLKDDEEGIDLAFLENNKIIRWVSGIQYRADHNSIREKLKNYPYTGEWLTKDCEYLRWFDYSLESPSTCWLRGTGKYYTNLLFRSLILTEAVTFPVGTGKSSLTSVVIEHFLTDVKPSIEQRVAYFYCSETQGRSAPLDIVRSLVAQLAWSKDGTSILPSIVEIYNDRKKIGSLIGNGDQPLRDECINLLKSLSNLCDQVIIVIDALDECSDYLLLLEGLYEVQKHSKNIFRFFFSSRMNVELPKYFENPIILKTNEKTNREDMNTYVNTHLEKLSDRVPGGDRPELKRRLMQVLIDRADGMFRWVELRFAILYGPNSGLNLEEDVEEELEELEKGNFSMDKMLNEAYDTIYERNTKDGRFSRHVASYAYKWLLCLTENLKAPEFLKLVSSTIQSAQLHRSKGLTKESLLKLCSNFVVFNEETNTFRFAHISVKEYLLRRRTEYTLPESHALAAETCLWYLCQPLREVHRRECASCQGYMFHCWGIHCNRAEAQNREKNPLKKQFDGFVKGSFFFRRWIREWKNHDYVAERDTALDCDSELNTVPLFVGCTYDLPEVVERELVELNDTEKKNSLHRTGLEVSCRYGSRGAMNKLLDKQAAITEDVVKEATTNFKDEEVIKLLLDRRSEEIQITEEIIETAADDEDGAKMIRLYLDRQGEKIQITEKIIKAAAANYYGEEIMGLLLDQQNKKIRITEEVVAIAASNPNDGRTMGLLLDRRGEEIQITEEIIKTTIWNLNDKTMELLLDRRGKEIQITEEVVKTAAENWDGARTIKLFLDRRNKDTQITEKIVKAAAKNSNDNIMELLLDRRSEDIQITEEVVEIAAGNPWNGEKMMELLLDRRSDEIQITEKMVIAAARNPWNSEEVIKLLLDRRSEEIQITGEVLKTAAGNVNNGIKIIKLLLDRRGEEIQVTEEVVIAAARSPWNGEEVIKLLLDRRGEEIQITEEALKAVAENILNGEKMMGLLLDRRGEEIQITEEVVVAAARNNEKIMKLLLDRRGEEIQITEEVLKAAARNWKNGIEILSLLLDRRDEEIQVTEEVLKAAVGNRASCIEIINLFLDRKGEEIHITEEVVKITAGSSEQMMKLLLDKEIEISGGTLEKVAKNSEKMMKLLLDRLGEDISITEEVIKAAADSNEKMMRLLSDRRDEITEKVLIIGTYIREKGVDTRRDKRIQVTEKLIKAATESNERMMKLLQDRRNEQLHTSQQQVIKEADPLPETT
ncbi:MAG: hypothetical protein M1834_003972 [Cirrosporium novae-zelandiae]|nr:MAG: hypothetical protein M1834_003972 [Cirrosporium novae-zelandiae]